VTFADRWNRFVYALWAPVYDTMIRFHPVSRVRDQAFSLVNIDETASVLLVGVGTGSDLRFLNPSSLILAADISPPMLRRCRAKAKQLNVPIVSVCSDASQLPCADKKFDVVVLTLIVSVVSNPRACLTEAMRVLQPGGRILVLDKFVPIGQRPSLFRRILNLLTRPFGTDINRCWEDLSSDLGTILFDETSAPGGSIRTIVVQKSGISATGSG
jgi:phosphatidylethanolamine/phosphatidyl-N-methylethanolamine N-methyltransferase